MNKRQENETNKSNTLLVGKTIKSIDFSAANVMVFHLTDNTAVSKLLQSGMVSMGLR